MLTSDFTVILGAVLYTFGLFFECMDEIVVFDDYGYSLLDIAVSFGFIYVSFDFYKWFAYGRFKPGGKT